MAVEPGWQFGSQYPGDPARIAVYDFLPDALLSQVANLEDFRAILVLDKWTGNADGRQCVFYRAMVRRPDSAGGRASFVARMIDHGYAFNGPNWDFPESAVQGLYARKLVYEGVQSLDDFQPWLDQVVHFPEEVIDRAWKAIPPDWIEGEEDALDRLLEQLFERRARVPAVDRGLPRDACLPVSPLARLSRARAAIPHPAAGHGRISRVLHQFVLHNDQIQEASALSLSPGQLGLLSGWGVFSTLRIADGVPFAWDRHWARLQRDAKALHVELPHDSGAVRARMLELVEANQAPNCTLRIAIVRNGGGMWAGPSNGRASDLIGLTADSKHWGDGRETGLRGGCAPCRQPVHRHQDSVLGDESDVARIGPGARFRRGGAAE